jgi:hypothetical protein
MASAISEVLAEKEGDEMVGLATAPATALKIW